MALINQPQTEPVRLKLARDHSRHLKQGYPWIYADWLAEKPSAKPGSRALVRDREGALFAFGMYDPESPIAVRVLALEREQLDEALIENRLASALNLRKALFDQSSTGYRLFNGEGDGLPGLVCDLYADHAVIKIDGAGPEGFWNLAAISEWLASNAGVTTVYQKHRSESETKGKLIFGTLKSPTVSFLENGIKFQANIVEGQKSGFFFDQRDNRARIGRLAHDKSVLNLFGYTGGFSIYSGMNGARDVTTVDLAKPAIAESEANWKLNGLPTNQHKAVVADAFEFMDQAQRENQHWDLIIVDPPSFAPAERHVEKAKQSYESLFLAALKCLAPDGIIALSSCSSHITGEMFQEICRAAFSKARRRAKVLGNYGQPEDHPFPFACRELQYLKFVMFRA